MVCVQGGEKVGVREKILAAPDVPTICAAFRRMPQSIDWQESDGF